RPARAVLARSALVSFGCDQDLQRRAILADHPHAVSRDATAERRGEAIGALIADPDLQHAVAVVLRPQLANASHLAKRELEAVPVVRRWKRCDDEVELAGAGCGAWRRDRGLRLLTLFDERLLDDRALRAVFLCGHQARLRCGRDRSIEPRRGRGSRLIG